MNRNSNSIILTGILLSWVFMQACGQNQQFLPEKTSSKTASNKEFTVVFYNVENLYDTINDPLTNDDEFTPSGRIPWTKARFETKEKNLSKVLSTVVNPGMPDIIGMAEVENRKVLESLISQEAMKSAPYGIVHFDSPDERGIDVALLYNRNTFTPSHSEAIPVLLEGDKTRDILFVTGKTSKGTEINIFVNHWPSRREGTEISENKRMKAASVLHQKVSEILSKNTKANILIMGDFNDNPDNKSITTGLSALPPDPPYDPKKLYDLLRPRFEAGKGSLYFKSWDLFDHIIISGNLLSNKAALECKPSDASIFDAQWLMYTTSKGESRPNRTAGSNYFGGYSDHLPVYLKLRVN